MLIQKHLHSIFAEFGLTADELATLHAPRATPGGPEPFADGRLHLSNSGSAFSDTTFSAEPLPAPAG